MRVEGPDTSTAEGQLDDLGQHVLTVNLEVLFNDCLRVEPLIWGSTLLPVFCPWILQRSEDPSVKQLEFMSCFRGEAVKNDRGAHAIAELLH